MKFSELKSFFDQCVENYGQDFPEGQDGECNALVIYSNPKQGMVISHDPSLHPGGDNASDIGFKRIGMLSSALWCALQRDYGREPNVGVMSLSSLLGALGGSLGGESQEETTEDNQTN
jgi:hypothetical protein